jgi:hypothetical protein
MRRSAALQEDTGSSSNNVVIKEEFPDTGSSFLAKVAIKQEYPESSDGEMPDVNQPKQLREELSHDVCAGLEEQQEQQQEQEEHEQQDQQSKDMEESDDDEMPDIDKSALSRWELGDDECAGLRRQQADDMEEAGRWMFEDAKNGGELTDMEFVLDNGKRVRGHRSWLMARCEYIRGKVSSGAQEDKSSAVLVQRCGDGAFLVLLEFLYTGVLGDRCFGQSWRELLELADAFGLGGMRERLLLVVTRGNVQKAVRLALEMDDGKLMERCIEVLPSRPAKGIEDRLAMHVADILSLHGNASQWKIFGKALVIKVVGAMLANETDASAQEHGLVAHWHISSSSHENCKEIGRVGGIQAVVSAMKGNICNRQIQELGCRVLLNLTCDDDLKKLVARAGGVETLQEALAFHKGNSQIHEVCGGVLTMLLMNNTGNQVRAGKIWGVETVVAALMAFKGRPQVQEQGCAALANLCCEPAAIRRAGEAGAVEAVLGALKTFKDHPGVQQQGCRALEYLSMNDVKNWRRVIEAKGIRDIVVGLTAHQDDPAVQASGCAALSNLWWQEQRHAALETAGICHDDAQYRCRALVLAGFLAVLSALQDHTASPEVQEHGCAALMRLFCDEEYRRLAGERGAVEAVVRALREHQSNTGVQANGCGAIWNLCDGDVENVRHVRNAGGVEAVVGALNEHKNDCRVQLNGCAALWNLCAGDPGIRCLVAETGGLEAIVWALTGCGQRFDFNFNSGMLFYACGALRHLVAEGGSSGDVIIRRRARKAGALEAVIHVLDTCKTSPNVQEQGCAVLEHLVPGNPDQIQMSLGAIVKALERYPNIPAVQEQGFASLEALFSDSDWYRRRAWEVGIFDVVLEAMEVHADSCEVQASGCGLLSSLSCDDENWCTHLIPIAVGAVLSALNAHRFNPRVQASGCAALWKFCHGDPQARRYVGEAGGVEALINALGDHLADPEVQEQGCGALANLYCDAENCFCDGPSTGFRSIIRALEVHRYNPNVLEEGCRALYNLCRHDGDKGRLVSAAGGLSAIIGAMKAHADHSELQKMGSEAIKLILSDSGE